jgi:hypothetical protein
MLGDTTNIRLDLVLTVYLAIREVNLQSDPHDLEVGGD